MPDTFLQSTFLDMFGDPITNPMGWEVKPLGPGHGVSLDKMPIIRFLIIYRLDRYDIFTQSAIWREPEDGRYRRQQ